MALLEVTGLSVATRGGRPLLEGIELEVDPGAILFLVGPSGAGKSLTLLALAGLLPPGLVARGRILLNGSDLSLLKPRARARHLGRSLSMVFQEPARCLNPVRTIGSQVAEAMRCRWGWDHPRAWNVAGTVLARVGLGGEDAVLRAYPHQLSGGMRQRVLLAAHLALRPELLLLDEPTASLDPIRAADLAAHVRSETRLRGMAAVWVSHDHRLAGALGDRVLHLDRGRLAGLSRVPVPPRQRKEGTGRGGQERPLLTATGLEVRLGGRAVLAGVDLVLPAGRVVALIGPSGAGKSTLIRVLAGLLKLHAGRVEGTGRLLFAPGFHPGPELRRLVQPLFQDPGGSLNPRRTIARSLEEGFKLAGRPTGRGPTLALLEEVGLPIDTVDRYPHQLSGGQRQRAALARALSVGPRVLLLDEPFSALDPASRDELSEGFRRQVAGGRALLLVSHHLAEAIALADWLGVLGHGRIVEFGPAQALIERPYHPWTRVLAECESRPGQAPPDWALASERTRGCPWAGGCPESGPDCGGKSPKLREVAPDRWVACHRPLGGVPRD